MRCKRLSGSEFGRLADVLGERVETVISVHLLRRGLCRAWVTGEVDAFSAVVIQGHHLPGEPTAFGRDAQAVCELLQQVPGWECVDVPSSIARAVGSIIEREMQTAVRYLDDVYHVLERPVNDFASEVVRRLGVQDVELVESSPRELQGGCFGDVRTMLTEGVAAGAIVGGRLVAIAHTSALSERYADIGVFTDAAFRRCGFATAGAALVAREVERSGRTPVWSTGEHNVASLRVAAKLGFREVVRTTYVVPEMKTN